MEGYCMLSRKVLILELVISVRIMELKIVASMRQVYFSPIRDNYSVIWLIILEKDHFG